MIDGRTEGLDVGQRVGELGCAVGPDDGSTVGREEGESVGEDGAMVGEIDGIFEGTKVGDVGLKVVGVIVGEQVTGKTSFIWKSNPT